MRADKNKTAIARARSCKRASEPIEAGGPVQATFSRAMRGVGYGQIRRIEVGG